MQTLTAILSAAKNISLALTIVLLLIAFIALLISGIGIMNIMLVTVKERTREIGIRKAIGAAHREIMYQFLFEAFLISGGGAVIGILIGLAIPAAVRHFFRAIFASRFDLERHRLLHRLLFHRPSLRLSSREPGRENAAHRIAPLRIK